MKSPSGVATLKCRRPGAAFGAVFVAIVVLLATGLLTIYGSQLRTLVTLRRIDPYPLYELHYCGDYGFAAFARRGAKDDRDLEDYLMRNLFLGSLGFRDEPKSGFACTVFAAHNAQGEPLVGRNFDHPYTPILVLYTHPPDGYASLSLVDLAYAGYSRTNLPTASLGGLFRLLAAPYLPFDGMNERGLTMALLAVPSAEPPHRPGRPSLNTTTAIRLVLDHARTVTEAITLLKQYNIYFSAGVAVHYLIADAAGDSAVVEYTRGHLEVVRRSGPYQVVTNFVLSDPAHPGDGQDRFATADRLLAQAAGRVEASRAMSILKEAILPGKTQWSAVYHLRRRAMDLVIAQNYTSVRHFRLPFGR